MEVVPQRNMMLIICEWVSVRPLCTNIWSHCLLEFHCCVTFPNRHLSLSLCPLGAAGSAANVWKSPLHSHLFTPFPPHSCLWARTALTNDVQGFFRCCCWLHRHGKKGKEKWSNLKALNRKCDIHDLGFCHAKSQSQSPCHNHTDVPGIHIEKILAPVLGLRIENRFSFRTPSILCTNTGTKWFSWCLVLECLHFSAGVETRPY